MFFEKRENALIARNENETLRIEAWGTNGIRVRATKNAAFSAMTQVLSEDGARASEITIEETRAAVENGKITCVLSQNGWLEFFKKGKSVLKEYWRGAMSDSEHSPGLRLDGRELKSVSGNDYRVTARFEADPCEKLFGMGQYQQEQLNLKGCYLELAQRNSQISIPFYVSNKGYGFLWNNAGIGEVMFGANLTKWTSVLSEELDYWVTADDTPKAILKNYTELTGRAPAFPENALGLWQCKLRYRTQEEVLAVARESVRRGVRPDVLVIDYFHWDRQGDWAFDPEYWPDPQAMIDELTALGIRCMVSIWPTVDEKSVNYKEMKEHGYFIRTERGTAQCFGYMMFYDTLNPEARAFVWKKVNENYGQYGIDLYWLDVAEPEYSYYDHEQYRHYTGPALKVGNRYPLEYARGFYEGLIAAGKTENVNLLRSAWAGSQKYAALVWSGDIKSNFTSLRDQLSAGLNIGLAGIPWWTTDTGGFISNVTDEHFNELLIRWFEFSTFSAVLRMHGDRQPHDIPSLSDLDHGGGFCKTGRPNELWSYGEEVFKILKKYYDLRLSMKDYIASLMREASENGSPVIRTMFYEFPEDAACWELDDQYMFGGKYLVAPVLKQGVVERSVYLPAGKWRNIHTGESYSGGGRVTVPAPLEIIPVFEKM